MTDHAVELPVDGAPRAWVRRPHGYWGGVSRRLSRDPTTLVCALILTTVVLAALLAPYLDLADPYRTSVTTASSRRGRQAICSVPTSSVGTFSPA